MRVNRRKTALFLACLIVMQSVTVGDLKVSANETLDNESESRISAEMETITDLSEEDFSQETINQEKKEGIVDTVQTMSELMGPYRSEDELYGYYLRGTDAIFSNYYGDSDLLMIPSSIDGYTVTELSYPKDLKCKTVYLPDTITYISSYEFKNCTALETIFIPGSVKKISTQAFMGCSNLKSVNLAEGVEIIGHGAFQNCTSLSRLKLPSSVKEIYGLFIAGTSIKNISIPSNASGMKVTISNWDHYPFEDAYKLETITFEDGRMSINDSFCRETRAKNIIIPDSVTSIGNRTFADATNLEKIEIPDSVTSFGSEVFMNCKALQKITLPSQLSVIQLGMFNGSGIAEIEIPKSVKAIGEESFYFCKNLTSIDIPASVQSIGNHAFSRSALERITIPNSVKRVYTGAFDSCNSLESVEFVFSSKSTPNVENVFVEEVKDEDLENHTIAIDWSLNTESDSSLLIDGQVFAGCSAMKTIVLPHRLKEVAADAFKSCNTLNEIQYEGNQEEWDAVTVKDSYLQSAQITYLNNNSFSGSEIWISTNPDFEHVQRILVPYVSEDSLKKTVTAEEKAKKYYVKIRSYCSDEQEGETVFRKGSWSEVVELTVKNYVSEAEVQQAVQAFYEVQERYIKALQTEAKADAKNHASNEQSKGQILREADEQSNHKLLTFSPGNNLSNIQKDKIYDVLANYMEETSKLKIEKIDVSKTENLDKCAMTIIKTVGENLCQNSGVVSKQTSSGLVELKLTGVSGSFFGSVWLNGKLVAQCNSGTKETWTTLTSYIENLREVTNDLMYQSLASIFKELGTVTGISDFINADISERLEGLENDLISAGYGKLQKHIQMIKEWDSVLEDIKKAATKDTLKDVLKDSKSIWKKIDSMDFSDSKVKKAVIADMTSEVEKQRSDLAKLIYEYAYGLEKDEPTSWIGKKIRKLMPSCPVDVVVYRADGSVAGTVRDGIASFQPDITMFVQGDTKQVWMDASQEYSIELIGTGTGTMNYIMQDLHGGQVVDQVDCYNIPLEEDKIYRQTVSGDSLMDMASKITLVSDTTWTSSPVTHLDQDGKPVYITVSIEDTEGGSAEGITGSVEKGSQVWVNAKPLSGYRFLGWYVNDTLKSTEEEYYFSASEDVTLEPRFAKNNVFNSVFGAIMGDDYKESMKIFLIENNETVENPEEESEKMVFYLDTDQENLTVTLKKQLLTGEIVSEQVSLTKESENKFISNPINLKLYQKIEITDEAGNIIATILSKNQIAPEICENDDHCLYVTEEEPATCGKDGYQKTKCYFCEYENIKSIKATGKHGFGDWKVIEAATVLTPQKQQRICTACGECETRVTGSKLQPTIKMAATVIPLKIKQKTTKFTVTGMGKGDSVVSWQSSNTKIFSVSGNADGTCKIKAGNRPGKAKLNITLASGLSKSIQVKVQKKAVSVSSIKGVPKKLTLTKGQSKQLSPTLNPITTVEKVKYKSSKKSVVKVSSKGVVKAVKKGTAKITVQAGKKKLTCTVVVK